MISRRPVAPRRRGWLAPGIVLAVLGLGGVAAAVAMRTTCRTTWPTGLLPGGAAVATLGGVAVAIGLSRGKRRPVLTDDSVVAPPPPVPIRVAARPVVPAPSREMASREMAPGRAAVDPGDAPAITAVPVAAPASSPPSRARRHAPRPSDRLPEVAVIVNVPISAPAAEQNARLAKLPIHALDAATPRPGRSPRRPGRSPPRPSRSRSPPRRSCRRPRCPSRYPRSWSPPTPRSPPPRSTARATHPPPCSPGGLARAADQRGASRHGRGVGQGHRRPYRRHAAARVERRGEGEHDVDRPTSACGLSSRRARHRRRSPRRASRAWRRPRRRRHAPPIAASPAPRSRSRRRRRCRPRRARQRSPPRLRFCCRRDRRRRPGQHPRRRHPTTTRRATPRSSFTRPYRSRCPSSAASGC